MKGSYLNIPISLCYWALQKKRIPELQLFCWLKTQCSGCFKLDNQILFAGITQLGITRQTFNKRLKWLLNNRWVTLNNKAGRYHINSFCILHNRTRFAGCKAVAWDNFDFRDFKAFVYAAVLFDLAKRKYSYDRILLKEQGRIVVKAGIKKRGSATCRDLPSFALPLLYAAKKLNTNKTFISSMKNAAKCAGFVAIKPVFEPLNIKPAEYEAFRQHHPEKQKLVKRKGKLCMQMPDKITFFIWMKKVRNLTQNKPRKPYRI